MKKDRNAFFNESQFTNMSYFPNSNPMNQMPIQSGSAMTNYYNGPIPQNMGYGNFNYQTDTSDIETRLNKIERQINRLDSRVSKLENDSNNISYNNKEVNSSIYMV